MLERDVYDMISGFTSLKKLFLKADIYDDDLPHLEAFPILGFIYLSSNSLNVVLNLGSPVKEISCNGQIINEIESLVSLQDLSVMNIEPSCSVSDAIMSLKPMVCNLVQSAIFFCSPFFVSPFF